MVYGQGVIAVMLRWWVSIGTLVLIVLAIILVPLPQYLTEPSTHPLRILDRNEALLYEVRRGASGSQDWLPYRQIPGLAVNAVIDTEDRTFAEHHGVSIRGTLRALYQNVTSGRVISGGSTITQQLIRIRRQSSRSLFSKILETYFAIRLEERMTKEEILEAYLNSAYFGHQAYGLQAAAKTYFGKAAHELSLSETSLLIGLLQSPSGYDPFQNFQKARERQKTVLEAMRSQGHITEDQQQEAEKSEIQLAPDRTEIEAPHFVFWVLNRDIPDDVTEIRTTLDLGLQHQAERAVSNQLEALQHSNVTSAAVVILDAQNGDILAMVGSADYFEEKHDGAVNVAISPRQPGSAIKPFTYALALAKGDTAATTVADVEAQFLTQEGNPYVPRNYDYEEHGLVRYREALANSYNISAVKILERVGVSSLLQLLRSAGVTSMRESPQHYGLALTLGDAEISLLELTRAFAIFPRGGRTLTERSFLSDNPDSGRSVLNPQVAWLISDILSDDNARLQQFGDQSALNFDFPVAVKTGTTRNSRDNWTIGYTPERVVGVWVGNADNSPMQGTSGVTGAGPIFHDVMLEAMKPSVPLRGRYDPEWPGRPPGIVDRDVCALSGKLPTPDCPSIIREKFIAGTEPQTSDDMFKKVQIDIRNGMRANDSCPKQHVREQTFAVFPPEVQRWSREHGWKEPPTNYSPLCGPSDYSTISTSGSWLMITRPADHDEFQLDPLVPNKNEKIVFEANASPEIKIVEWFVDGVSVGTGKAPDFRLELEPRVGEWRIEAKSLSLRKWLQIVVLK